MLMVSFAADLLPYVPKVRRGEALKGARLPDPIGKPFIEMAERLPDMSGFGLGLLAEVLKSAFAPEGRPRGEVAPGSFQTGGFERFAPFDPGGSQTEPKNPQAPPNEQNTESPS